MPNLLRKPLAWMVVIECVVVASLALVAWHMVAAAQAPQAPGPSAAFSTAPAHAIATSEPTAVTVEPITELKPLLPGLNLDSSFWRLRLAELNRGESSFVQLEWTIVHSAMDAARRYVKAVVLPSIVRAERAGR